MTGRQVMAFSGVSRTFNTPAGDVNALKEVNLSISEGEFLVITGPSGSGKSTLLHICALIDSPSSGTVSMLGTDISAATELELCRMRKTQIGLVFQRFCLLPHRTVLDNILFRFRYLDSRPPDAADLAQAAMRQVGIDNIPDRLARLLSSGEQQRVAIARAVVQKPRLLLADEPTGNLDSASATAVMDCFKKLNDSGITIVMVTHNESLLPYASRHLVCVNGRLEEGPLP